MRARLLAATSHHVLHWCCIGIALVLHWDCIGIALVLHWCCIGIALMLHWYCIGVALVLHWCRIGIALVLHWHCIGLALVLHWYCIGIALGTNARFGDVTAAACTSTAADSLTAGSNGPCLAVPMASGGRTQHSKDNGRPYHQGS